MPDLTTMLGGACAFALLGALFAFFVTVMNWYENKKLQRKKEWEKWRKDMWIQEFKKDLREREKGPP